MSTIVKSGGTLSSSFYLYNGEIAEDVWMHSGPPATMSKKAVGLANKFIWVFP